MVNVDDPTAVVRDMVSLVRPGGSVALQDIDWVSRICHPPLAAWDVLIDAIATLWSRNGQDVHIGRKLPGLLRDAGLVDVEIYASTRVFTRGHPFHTLLVDRAIHCRDALIEHDLLTGEEIDDCVAQLRIHLDRPDSLVLHGTFFHTWGRVPRKPATTIAKEFW